MKHVIRQWYIEWFDLHFVSMKRVIVIPVIIHLSYTAGGCHSVVEKCVYQLSWNKDVFIVLFIFFFSATVFVKYCYTGF